MQTIKNNTNLYIKQIKEKGRGVFAAKQIKKGQIIETCPVIIIPKENISLLDKTYPLDDYYYNEWGENKEEAIIILGYGMIYNHSFNPNAHFNYDLKNKQVIYFAIKNINKDEEITINYNGEPADRTPVWFNPL